MERPLQIPDLGTDHMDDMHALAELRGWPLTHMYIYNTYMNIYIMTKYIIIYICIPRDVYIYIYRARTKERGTVSWRSDRATKEETNDEGGKEQHLDSKHAEVPPLYAKNFARVSLASRSLASGSLSTSTSLVVEASYC